MFKMLKKRIKPIVIDVEILPYLRPSRRSRLLWPLHSEPLGQSEGELCCGILKRGRVERRPANRMLCFGRRFVSFGILKNATFTKSVKKTLKENYNNYNNKNT